MRYNHISQRKQSAIKKTPEGLPANIKFLVTIMTELKFLDQYGVNTEDRGLISIWHQYENHQQDAVAALREAFFQKRLKNSNAYLKAALRENWKPDHSRFYITPIAS